MAEAEFELLGTPGCHLCDEAQAMVASAAAARGFRWRYLDIAADDALVARYGERIPVLRCGSEELGWPFGLLDIVRFTTRR